MRKKTQTRLAREHATRAARRTCTHSTAAQRLDSPRSWTNHAPYTHNEGGMCRDLAALKLGYRKNDADYNVYREWQRSEGRTLDKYGMVKTIQRRAKIDKSRAYPDALNGTNKLASRGALIAQAATKIA